MAKESAGLLIYRRRDGRLEVFLVHPGGPYWAKKDKGTWTIPKGEPEPGEDLEAAARRETAEELGVTVDGAVLALEPVRQKGGKVVHAWAVEADVDPGSISSNTFAMEWPPRSGRTIEVPEIDRAAWFSPAQAREKINPAQTALIDELEERLSS